MRWRPWSSHATFRSSTMHPRTRRTGAEVDGHRLTEDEIGISFGMLLCAGNGPTRAAIASGMLALMQHPDQLEAVRASPSLLRCTKSGLATAALAEILRWSSPVNYF